MGFHLDLNEDENHAPSNQKFENDTGSTINRLKCVKVTDFGTNYPTVAIANGITDKVVGVVRGSTNLVGGVITGNVENGGTGYYAALGVLQNMDTSAWTAATALYCDASGNLTSSLVGGRIGTVLSQHASTGSIYLMAPDGEKGEKGDPVNTLTVADIAAPDTELNAISGSTDKELLFVGQDISTKDVFTLYAYDSTSSASVNSPFIVASSTVGANWIAVSGRYTDQILESSTGAILRELELKGGAGEQDVVIDHNADGITFEGQNSSARTIIAIKSKDSDKSDAAELRIFGLGDPTVPDREFVDVEWSASRQQYEIYTDQAGSGVVNDLVLRTNTNTDQLKLEASTGFVGLGLSTANEKLTVEGRLSLDYTTSPSLTAGYGKIYCKTDDVLYYMDGNGSEVDLSSPSIVTPGGSDTQIQFNDSSSFNGDEGLSYNKTTNVLTIKASENAAATKPLTINDSDAAEVMSVDSDGKIISNTLSGSASSAADLNINSTENATKGNIFLDNAYFSQHPSVSSSFTLCHKNKLATESTEYIFYVTNGAETTLNTGVNRNLYFSVGASKKMNISNLGHLGIGDITPDARLEVSGDGLAALPLFMLSLNDTGDGDILHVGATGDMILRGSTNDGTTNILSLKDSDAAEVASIDSNGVLRAFNSYGEMYFHNTDTPSVITATDAGTFYGFVDAVTGEVAGTGLVTFDGNGTADRLTIGAGGAGIYRINIVISYSGSNSQAVEGALFHNDAEIDKVSFERGLGTSPPVGSASCCGIVSLSASDYIDFRMKSNDAGGTISISHYNFSMTRISS